MDLGKYQTMLCNNREIPSATLGNRFCNFWYFYYALNRLGDFIKMIREADELSPLYRLNQYIEEIEELNNYSKIYHHSNPNYMDIAIDPVELMIQVKNTIHLLHVL